jgi:hypothetical protein
VCIKNLTPFFKRKTFKNIDDILRHEAGCSTELDYTEQTSWLLFLKPLAPLLTIVYHWRKGAYPELRSAGLSLSGASQDILVGLALTGVWIAPYVLFDGLRLGDPLIAEEHIACFNWASNEEMQDISSMAIRINDFLCGMFAAIDIRLVDFKLEFGRLWDQDYSRIILADEISPDGCRLWDINTGEKLDKDRFRRDLGGEEEAYREVARRLGLLKEEDSGPGEVFDLSAHRGRLRSGKPKKKG